MRLLPLITLFVAAPAYAQAPTVTLTAPADGTTYAIGTSINFTASATDVEDDDTTLTSAIAWSSSLDGA
ncbi:MAG: Ig-like domain-containing protein, partial [Woeseiaceae bacterium]|nr:Ig-like domain-containing protein [Woeseiaceae bacterium]